MRRLPYSRDYFPTAPILQVRLGLPDESLQIGPLAALVDTGADGTIVPQYILEELGAEPDNDKVLRSYSGESVIVKMYYLDIAIEEQRYPAIAVAGDPRADQIILGRNLLNKLVITLNGPKQELEIEL